MITSMIRVVKCGNTSCQVSMGGLKNYIPDSGPKINILKGELLYSLSRQSFHGSDKKIYN